MTGNWFGLILDNWGLQTVGFRQANSLNMFKVETLAMVMRRALVSRRPLSPFSRTCLSLVPYRMAGSSVKSRGHVTDRAKVDLIGPTQAGDNERHRVEVSRSFICRYTDMIIIRVNLNLFMTER